MARKTFRYLIKDNHRTVRRCKSLDEVREVAPNYPRNCTVHQVHIRAALGVEEPTHRSWCITKFLPICPT